MGDQDNRGCYVHTQPIAKGNGAGRHHCWVFSNCNGKPTSEPQDCSKEKGFCVLEDGSDQNSGVVKINDVNGDDKEAEEECLKTCKEYPGATGCETIWDQGNRGCYVHTEGIAKGNGVDRHNCWVFSKCNNDCPKEIGFCVHEDGSDQNSGVIKINDVDGGDKEAEEECLKTCKEHPGATGCETIWDQDNRGCYVHTQPIAKGNGAGRHHCWVFSNCHHGHL